MFPNISDMVHEKNAPGIKRCLIISPFREPFHTFHFTGLMIHQNNRSPKDFAPLFTVNSNPFELPNLFWTSDNIPDKKTISDDLHYSVAQYLGIRSSDPKYENELNAFVAEICDAIHHLIK